jgi:hypothetical protein
MLLNLIRIDLCERLSHQEIKITTYNDSTIVSHILYQAKHF